MSILGRIRKAKHSVTRKAVYAETIFGKVVCPCGTNACTKFQAELALL